MLGLLKRYIAHNITIDSEKLEAITSKFKPLNFKRNTTLHRQGELCDKLYFINSGCARVFYLSEQGAERTRYFAFDGMVVTALASFISGEASFEFVEVLDDAELLAISRKDFFELTETITEWKDFYRKLLEHAYINSNRLIERLVMRTAKERYEQLLSQNPRVVQQIANKIVASYLDISPETLSRIKSR
ncbi:Crp/Fnr family transcriptional regulator [Mucilaginibacter sp.]|uniref:Crp/Fnr family transcriptional regulator n=1 Tax=Mucilaginibacter sp. TaxID=1882438 RepID=UPI003267A26A